LVKSKQIQITVVVVIVVVAPHRPVAVANGRRDRVVDAREVAVAVVAVERIRVAQSVGDNQVEVAVVIVVAPGAAKRVCGVLGDGAVGDAGEGCAALLTKAGQCRGQSEVGEKQQSRFHG
jgi:hypothetical protein